MVLEMDYSLHWKQLNRWLALTKTSETKSDYICSHLSVILSSLWRDFWKYCCQLWFYEFAVHEESLLCSTVSGTSLEDSGTGKTEMVGTRVTSASSLTVRRLVVLAIVT